MLFRLRGVKLLYITWLFEGIKMYNNNKFLQSVFNPTATTNGAGAYKSTLSALLDFYYKSATMFPAEKETVTHDYFNRDHSNLIKLFTAAFQENQDYAMRLLYELRDFRSPIGGRGRKSVVAIIYRHLADLYPEKFTAHFSNIVEYGSWKDLLWLFDTKVEVAMMDFWIEQIREDFASSTPTLAAKWFPSENSGKLSKSFFRKFVQFCDCQPQALRKAISTLRNRIKLVETQMSKKDWSEIDYSSVPSQASKLYAKTFWKHDAERYELYLKQVEKGKAKMNVQAVEMYEVFHNPTVAAQAQFQEIIKLVQSWIPEGVNFLPIVDTSSSMTSWMNIVYNDKKPTKFHPMDIAIGIGIALSKGNKGTFKDAMFNFDERPTLHYFPDNNFQRLYNNVKNMNWGGNTNLLAVFDTLLTTARNNHLKSEDLPNVLIVLSDMQFDGNSHNWRASTFDSVKSKYQKAGFNMPLIVWWSINGSNNNVPVTKKELGTLCVSGWAQSVAKTVVSGVYSPNEVIEKIVNHERYNKIVW